MGKDKSRARTSGKSKSKSRAPANNSEERLYYGDGSYLWFDSEEERTRFLTFFSKQVVAPPRIVPERLPELQGYDNLDAQLHQTGLWPFVSQARKEINPTMIRAFYSNLRREDDFIVGDGALMANFCCNILETFYHVKADTICLHHPRSSRVQACPSLSHKNNVMMDAHKIDRFAAKHVCGVGFPYCP
ncbi:unnamed protein product [Cuscuta campestris]|uniref:Uncharacterized protein n=1 Tax=Cuscuta campestris TaxID=132261 RepID=A0A484MGA0_9ASTE|nr:unnamed protein product [Cuscuta campestris]